MATKKTRKAARPAKKRVAKKKAVTARSKRSGTKTEQLMGLLAGPGSTVEAMCKALGWQAHTLRAALTRLPDGKKATRERTDGVTSYRLA
jgi:hypothetical protein